MHPSQRQSHPHTQPATSPVQHPSPFHLLAMHATTLSKTYVHSSHCRLESDLFLPPSPFTLYLLSEVTPIPFFSLSFHSLFLSLSLTLSPFFLSSLFILSLSLLFSSFHSLKFSLSLSSSIT